MKTMRTGDRTSACVVVKQHSCAAKLIRDSVETVGSDGLELPQQNQWPAAQQSIKLLQAKPETSAYSAGGVHRSAADAASLGTPSRKEQGIQQSKLYSLAPQNGSLNVSRVQDALQEKDSNSNLTPQQQRRQSSVLDVAPVAVRFPPYGKHFRYELSEFKAFWSCDLHYRDWRQVVAASPFPNAVPPNRLLILRSIICLAVVAAEIVATTHAVQVTGWATFLYFTTMYCILECVYWMLLTAMSLRALLTWEKPLHTAPNMTPVPTTGPPSETVSGETSRTEQGRASAAYARDFKDSWPAATATRSGAQSQLPQEALVPSGRDRIRRVTANIRRFWRMQGYKDLLADSRFCFNGIILAPNPSCSAPAREITAAGCGSGSESACSEAKDYEPSCVRPVQQPLVSVLWIIHSLQLICSTVVFIVFFSSMRANGTPFTEFWFTVWRHSVLIFVTVLHSALLTRIPFPLRHVVFAFITWAVYVIVQVCVFALSLPNGEGDRGCVYRAFSLERPYQFVGYGCACFAVVNAVAVGWWSLLRQRAADVDPPPSFSVPVAEILRQKQDVEAGQVQE